MLKAGISPCSFGIGPSITRIAVLLGIVCELPYQTGGAEIMVDTASFLGIADKQLGKGVQSDLGRLIVFEGPNEVGKTTVSRELSKKLNSRGRLCEWHSFPGQAPGTLGQHIYNLHHQPEIFGLSEIQPSAMQALHIAAHLEAIEHSVLPKLGVGIDIVLDRYWWSTVAYGIATGVPKRLLDSLVASELVAWNGLQPALLVLLDRSLAKPQSPEQSCTDTLRLEYRGLLESAKGQYPVRFIENNGTVEQAVARIIDLLDKVSAPVGDVE